MTHGKKLGVAEHLELNERYGARNYAPLDVVLARGEGAFVWDVEGKRYVDFLSAYSALNQGHRHPRIVAALVAQAERLTLTSRAFHNDLLGPMLARIATLVGFEKVLPMNTGAEAVETAIKAMRRHGYERRGIPDGEGEIVVAEGNFHGRTTTIVSMSSDPSSYGHYGPLTPGFVKVPFGDAGAVARALGPKTVGVLLEPIQGEGGVVVPPDDYLPRVRAACDAAGVPLCLDEIQTGLGRTGRLLAADHVGVRPDLLVLGKALSGGVYPVSALCADTRIMDVFTPGTHGSTYGGNPLAAAVTLAALDVLVEEDLPGRAARLGEAALDRLRRELGSLPHVKEVRGRGLMMAVEFHSNSAHDHAEALARRGVLAKDTHGSTIRLLPPLVISEPDLDDALDVIVDVLGHPRPS